MNMKKHLTLAMAAAFAVSAASAAIVATNNFETAYDGFSPDSGDIASLVSLVDYESVPLGSVPAPFADFGAKYMSLDTDDATVWRSFAEQSADVYFDSYVQMTPCAGDVSYTNDAKFVVFMDAETNLCVISGTSKVDTTPVTNTLMSSSQITAGSWHRLTVHAAVDGVYSFVVFVDGIQRGGTNYSLYAGTTMSQVGMKGTGAVDDLVVRTTAPAFSGKVATIDGEDFATVEDALAASNGKTVTLTADHAAAISTPLAIGTSYSIAKNGHAFGGFTAVSGATIAKHTSAGVTTYTSTPKPLAVWTGNFDKKINGYTLNLNGNALSQDKSTITINQPVGVTVDFLTGMTSGMTVMFKYSNLNLANATNTLATSFVSGNNENRTGVCLVNVNGNGSPYGIWNTDFWAGATSAKTTANLNNTSGVLAFTYQPSSGTSLYYVNNGVGSTIYSCSGLGSPSYDSQVNGFSIGGERTKAGKSLLPAATGMSIDAIAVFSGRLTDEQMQAYVFPSAASTTVSAEGATASSINAALGDVNEGLVDVADGATITIDSTIDADGVFFISSGSIGLSAGTQPDSSRLSNMDFFGVEGAVLRSWLSPGVVGFNFNATGGRNGAGNTDGAADTSLALEFGTWHKDAYSPAGSSTNMFSDGISVLSWRANNVYAETSGLTSGTFIQGYLDDGGLGVTLTLTAVPYESYDVIIYCSTDDSTKSFKAKTVNGTIYTWDSDSGQIMTTNDADAVWGLASAAAGKAVYGANTLRINGLSGQLQIKGGTNSRSARGCISAIQIMPAGTSTTPTLTIGTAGESTSANWSAAANWEGGRVATSGAAIINVSGSVTLTLDETVSLTTLEVNGDSDAELTLVAGTGSFVASSAVTVKGCVLKQGSSSVLGATPNVYIMAGSTLDLNGYAVDSTTEVYLATPNTTLNVPNDSGTPKVSGFGVCIFTGHLPTTDNWFTDGVKWKGTIWIKDCTVTDLNLNNYGNANSVVRLTNVAGYLACSTEKIDYSVLVFNPTIDLYDGSGAFALRLNNGNSYDYNNYYRSVAFSALKGDGTLVADSSGGGALVSVRDWSNFTGTLSLTNKIVSFGATTPLAGDINTSGGEVWIMSDATVDIPSGRVWHAPNGIVVAGTLSYESIARLSTATEVRLKDGGVIGVSGASLPADFATQAAKVSGSGNFVFANSVSIPFETVAGLSSGVGVQLASGSTINIASAVTAEAFASVMGKATGSWNIVVDGCSLSFENLDAVPEGVGVVLSNGGSIAVSDESMPEDFATQAAKVSGSGNFAFANSVSIPSATVASLAEGVGVQLSSGSVVSTSGDMSVEDFAAVAAKVSGTGTFFVDNGSIKYDSLSALPANMAVVLGANGMIEVTGAGSADNFAKDFSKVSGTGAVKYTGSSWGGISTNNLASTIGVVLENTAGVIVPNALTPSTTTENIIPVGYLSGSGRLRCDFNWNSSGTGKARTLRVQQDRDSEWSGTHNDNQSRLTLSVAPGVSTAGTLTLSGVQTQNAALVVEAGAKVKLADPGIWKGNVTVAGTFGGNGTVDGSLTISNGGKINAVDGVVTVSNGTLTVPEGARVEVHFASAPAKGTTIMSVSGTGSITVSSGATFEVYVDGARRSDLKVKKVDNDLKIASSGAIINIF